MTTRDDDPRDELDDEPDDFLRAVARAPEVAPPVAEPEREGTTLGKYRVGPRIGRGAMGVVYAGEDTDLGRRVAIKVLPPDAVAVPARRKRFFREARAASKIHDPRVATVFEIGEAEGTVYLAMELVAGRTLRAVLREAAGPLALGEAVRVARELALGLARAHEAGVVHRDLKPENVMLDDRGGVKILDFGLAKPDASFARGEGDDLETAEGHVLGTPGYMSPEQARGRPVDARSDVFSLGVMLYEMSTGARPFGGGTTLEELISVDRDEPSPPRRANPAVPAALERVVLRCMEKAPDDRYASAADLARALEDVDVTRAAAPGRRLAIAALAVGAAVALGLFARTSRAPSPPAAAPVVAADGSASPAPSALASGSPASSASSAPEGSAAPARVEASGAPPSPKTGAPRPKPRAPRVDPWADQK